MRIVAHLLLGGLLVGPAVAPASGQPPAAALELVGPDQVSRSLSLADLAALPQVEIETLDRDGAHAVFRGPTLRSLATMAGAPAGRALRGPAILTAIWPRLPTATGRVICWRRSTNSSAPARRS